MRVTRIVPLAAACVLFVAVAAFGAAGATAAAHRSVTFHLVEKDLGFNYIDNPPRQGVDAPPLIGDQFAFSSELLTRSGKHAGMIEALCTIARGGVHASATCSGNALLKGGQLAVMAAIGLSGTGTDHIAIVGGTGVYEGVSGSVASRSRGENSPFSDDTVHIVYP
jgi:hypothetical protein